MTLVLFDEARAASIVVNAPATVANGNPTTAIIVDVHVPDGQRLPMASVEVVIERSGTGSAVKNAAANPTVTSQAICNTPVPGCTSPTVLSGTAINSILLDNFYLNEVGTGYIVDNGYFGACAPCTVTRDGGYGYLPGAGYGYGGVIPVNPGPENTGSGYGYGGEELIIRFVVTLNSNAMATGTYWLTFLVNTSSGVIGDLSSPATSFIVEGGGGSGGGTSTTGTNTGTGAGQSQTVTATPATPPAGATASYRATVTAQPGNQLTINTPQGDVKFVPSEAITGTVTVSHFPPANPPPGVGPAPPGVTFAGFMQITVSSGGESHTVTVAVTVPAASAGDPSKAVLVKWDPATSTWTPKSKVTLTQNADGSFSGSGTSDCCSDYAVAFDAVEPEVALSVPAGVLSDVVTLTASATDNLLVAKVLFYVGDQLVGEDSTAPYTATVNTATFENGDHVMRAVAEDFVGNEAESSAPATFENEGATPGGPTGPGDKPASSSWLVILIILIVIAIIGAAGYYFYQQQKK